MDVKKKNVVIIGGGFAGIETARVLARNLPETHEITLISNKSYFEYYPALYRIVTGASPIEACVPLKDMLPKRVSIKVDTVTSLDLDQHMVVTERAIYRYDYLVVALGSVSTYFALPGIESLSLGFRSTNEALKLRAHLEELFRRHEQPPQNELVSHFHIIIAGGGPSGVEVAGDLSAYLHTLASTYGADPSFITIDLIEAGPRVLPTFPPDVSERVLAKLRTLGVNIFLNRRLMSEDVDSVYFKDMSVQSKTVIWTAGTTVNPLITETERLTLDNRKRVTVDEYLRAVGFDDVFVVGDAASTPFSGLAQTAIYDGVYVGNTITKLISQKEPKKYQPKQTGYSLPVGDNWGVFVMKKFRLYGRIAYELRHLIDFSYFFMRLPIKKLLALYIAGWKYRKVSKS